MHLYLDESGDLGFDFSLPHTSRYLIMACLICKTLQSVQTIQRAGKLTLKNKMGVNAVEMKGSNTSLRDKKYFYRHAEKDTNWEIMTIAADKQNWLRHHIKPPNKNFFYDEIANHLLSQTHILPDSTHIQLIVDKSKTQRALKQFNHSISTIIHSCVSSKTLVSIDHRQSHADLGLQATDLFGWGIYRKYQQKDNEWYDTFRERIVLEMKFKF